MYTDRKHLTSNQLWKGYYLLLQSVFALLITIIRFGASITSVSKGQNRFPKL